MSEGDPKKTCFVVMGFGEKDDYKTGRKLNLDKTYTNIIKPAVKSAGLECIRADDVQHSGYIDKKMYEQLWAADLVVADLSTSNLNAAYELGVRHALRPYTTIVIAESQFEPPFDTSHVVVRKYEHMGKGIDYDEVVRARDELEAAIKEIIDKQDVDSPVFTFLPALRVSELTTKGAGATGADEPEESSQTIGALRSAVEAAKAGGDWAAARATLAAMEMIAQNDSWVVQQLALATYKQGDALAKKNDADGAREHYEQAEQTLRKLKPHSTADTETLGLWAALFKRRYELALATNEDEATRAAYVDEAINALQKGFLILDDYYNGINLAYMLNVRSAAVEGSEAIADAVTAQRVRRRVIEVLGELDLSKIEGDDRYWATATMEEAHTGLGNAAEAEKWATKAQKVADDLKKEWMRRSTSDQIAKLEALLDKAPTV